MNRFTPKKEKEKKKMLLSKSYVTCFFLMKNEDGYLIYRAVNAHKCCHSCNMLRAARHVRQPGIEPGTSPTLKENRTTRPLAHNVFLTKMPTLSLFIYTFR